MYLTKSFCFPVTIGSGLLDALKKGFDALAKDTISNLLSGNFTGLQGGLESLATTLATEGFSQVQLDQLTQAIETGAPPPVLLFEYLGDHGYNKVPVVVSHYNFTYPNDVDYVPVEVQGTVTYVPTLMQIVITLSPQYTPSKIRRRFDVNALANGEAYRDGFI